MHMHSDTPDLRVRARSSTMARNLLTKSSAGGGADDRIIHSPSEFFTARAFSQASIVARACLSGDLNNCPFRLFMPGKSGLIASCSWSNVA